MSRVALDFFRDYERNMFLQNVIVYDQRLNLNPNSFQLRPVYHPNNIQDYVDRNVDNNNDIMDNGLDNDFDNNGNGNNDNDDDNNNNGGNSAYDFGDDETNSRQRRG